MKKHLSGQQTVHNKFGDANNSAIQLSERNSERSQLNRDFTSGTTDKTENKDRGSNKKVQERIKIAKLVL